MQEISVDSYTLLEHMVAKSIPCGDQLKYEGGLPEICEEAGLTNYSTARAAYTKPLKDAGLLEFRSRQWYINLSVADTTVVHGLDAKVSEILPKDKVFDISQPAPEEAVSDEPVSATIEDDLSKITNVELASAIARELFDRLDASESKRIEETNNLRNTMASELDSLKTQLEAEVAARTAAELAKREAEKQAVDNKTQKERLEFQYSQMMKEIASAQDGEEITAAARRFLRPGADDARRVAAASSKVG